MSQSKGRSRRLVPSCRIRRRLVVEALEPRVVLATFMVTNTGDSAAMGSGSLRAAILASNASTVSLPNVIDFNIPGSAVQVITPTSYLPSITEPVDIDGQSQGTSASPLIELDGAAAGPAADGITLANVASCTVSGLSIVGFSAGAGVVITGVGATGNVLEADYIGLAADGSTTVPNMDGVVVTSNAASNTIGSGDVISGNNQVGVDLSFSASGNVVVGDDIGTENDGMTPAPNGTGVYLEGGAFSNTIGGTTPGVLSVISGNTNYGIDIVGADTSHNLVEGDFIGEGTDGSTTGPAPNGVGVAIANSATGNTIGGASNGTVIMYNENAGVSIVGTVASPLTGEVLNHDKIVDNGGVGVRNTDATGTTLTASSVQGTTGPGISVVASTGVIIGGTAAGAGVMVVGNTGVGITTDFSSSGAVIAGSTISGNTGAGVDANAQAALTSDLIQSNTSIGVIFAGANDSSVVSSTIGGASAGLGNGSFGIELVDSQGATIGGASAGAGDLIEDNASDGVNVLTSSTLIDGSTISGNAGDGVNALGPLTLASDLIQSNSSNGVLINSSATTVTSVTSSTIGGAGVLGNGGIGISVVTSINVTIGGTTAGSGDLIEGNVGGGVDFGNGSNNGLIAGSTISGNTGAGISFGLTSGSPLSGEVVTGDSIQTNSPGLLITDAPGTKVLSSTILGNTGEGISVVGSSGVIIGGTATGSGDMIDGNGGSSGGPGVIFDSTSPGGLVAGSTIAGNIGPGISFLGTTGSLLSGEVVTGDSIQDNDSNGVRVTDAPGTSITASNFNSNDVAILVQGSPKVTIGGLTAGSGDTISNTTDDGIDFDNASPNALIAGSTIAGGQDFGDLALSLGSAAAVVVGDKIQSNFGSGVLIDGASGTSVLSSTIGGATSSLANNGVAISVVGSTKVTIGGTTAGSGDLIEGNNGDGVDFDDTSTGGMVVGSTISGNTGVGVSFNGTTGSSLSGEVLASDLIQSNTGIGVQITDAPGTIVTSSTIGGATSALGNGAAGISVVGSAKVTVGGTTAGSGDTIESNTGDGVDFDDISTGGMVASSTISGNTGVGVSFNGTTGSSLSGEVVTSDVIQSNTKNGVRISDAAGTIVKSSTIGGLTTALGNGAAGISVVGSANVTIGGTTPGSGVLVEGNAGDGIDFDAKSPGGLIASSTIFLNTGVGLSLLSAEAVVGDTIQTNGASGVVISGVSGVRLTGLVIRSNGGVDLLISHAPGTSVTSSTIGGPILPGTAGAGISVVGSANVTIGGAIAGSGDTIEGHDGDGVDFDDTSTGGMVVGSTIFGNTGVGVNFLGMTGSSLSGEVLASDLIQSNTGIGVQITDAPGTIVTSSTIGGATSALGNGAAGISVVGSANVTIGGTTPGSGDLIEDNKGDGIDSDGKSPGGLIAGSTISGNTGAGLSLLSADILVGDTIQSNGASGIVISGVTGASVTGLNIRSNGGVALLITDAPGTSVRSSTIGGPILSGTAGVGISVVGSANVTIGGTTPGSGVLVQDNASDGIDFDDKSPGGVVAGSTITGNSGVGVNFLGMSGSSLSGAALTLDVIQSNTGGGVLITDAPGTSVVASTIGGAGLLGNGLAGISLVGSNSSTIGGTSLGSGNFISGNVKFGVEIQASDTLLEGNIIGLAADGKTPVGNGTGVAIVGPVTGNTIGGTTSGARNVISGNSTGVLLGSGSMGDVVEGDEIGLAADGVTPAGNRIGVIDESGGDTIGGITAGARDVISGNTGAGVVLADLGLVATASLHAAQTGGNVNTLEGDYIGLTAAGTSAAGNGIGVMVGLDAADPASSVTIGAGDVISGNATIGVDLAFGSGDVVAGALIGLAADGRTPIGNGIGVMVGPGVSGDIVGGAGVAHNVISGNIMVGVALNGAGTSGNLVEGNVIGLAADGLTLAGNGSGVVVSAGASGNVIGGTSGLGNVISGNVGAGVYLSGAGTSGNLVEGNVIGLDASVSAADGNGGAGVLADSGASQDGIGGVAVGDSNVIGFNGGAGVAVVGPGTVGISIVGNSIFDNRGTGIALSGGGNAGASSPMLLDATTTGSSTQVLGSVAGVAGSLVLVELFANRGPDQASTAEGQFPLGSQLVRIGAGGSTTFTIAIPAGYDLLTATGSDAAGNTSAFGGPLAQTDLSVTQTTSPSTVLPGSPFSYRVTVTNRGPNPATDVVITDVLPAGLPMGPSGVAVTGVAGATHSISQNVLTVVLPSLPVGGSALVTISYGQAPANTLLQNNVTVNLASGVVNTSSTDNTATLQTFVAPKATPSSGRPTYVIGPATSVSDDLTMIAFQVNGVTQAPLMAVPGVPITINGSGNDDLFEVDLGAPANAIGLLGIVPLTIQPGGGGSQLTFSAIPAVPGLDVLVTGLDSSDSLSFPNAVASDLEVVASADPALGETRLSTIPTGSATGSTGVPFAFLGTPAVGMITAPGGVDLLGSAGVVQIGITGTGQGQFAATFSASATSLSFQAPTVTATGLGDTHGYLVDPIPGGGGLAVNVVGQGSASDQLVLEDADSKSHTVQLQDGPLPPGSLNYSGISSISLPPKASGGSTDTLAFDELFASAVVQVAVTSSGSQIVSTAARTGSPSTLAVVGGTVANDLEVDSMAAGQTVDVNLESLPSGKTQGVSVLGLPGNPGTLDLQVNRAIESVTFEAYPQYNSGVYTVQTRNGRAFSVAYTNMKPEVNGKAQAIPAVKATKKAAAKPASQAKATHAPAVHKAPTPKPKPKPKSGHH